MGAPWSQNRAHATAQKITCTLCPRRCLQEWVEASVKHRRAVVWAPAAEAQLEEACSERRRKGDQARMRFFRGDDEGAKMYVHKQTLVQSRNDKLASTTCIGLLESGRVDRECV